jgi:predicted membrane protein
MFISLLFGEFFTTKEKVITPSREFQWTSFAEQATNFWKILIPSHVHLIEILISSMMVIILYRVLQDRAKETENKLPQLNVWIDSTKSLMLQLRENVVHMEEMEEDLRAEILQEMSSAKKMKKEEEKFCAQLQNDKLQIKKAMKKSDELYAVLQKDMDSLKKIITAKERVDAKLQHEMRSFKKKL